MASEEPSATSGVSGGQVRRNVVDRQANTSSSVAAGTGIQSDDSDFYALGADWEPPKMSESLVKFLYSRAAVPIEFLSEFEKVSLSWNLKKFLQWFSTGTTFDIAVRFGVEFCLKYPIQIARVVTLHRFLLKHPLVIEVHDPTFPIINHLILMNGGLS